MLFGLCIHVHLATNLKTSHQTLAPSMQTFPPKTQKGSLTKRHEDALCALGVPAPGGENTFKIRARICPSQEPICSSLNLHLWYHCHFLVSLFRLIICAPICRSFPSAVLIVCVISPRLEYPRMFVVFARVVFPFTYSFT